MSSYDEISIVVDDTNNMEVLIQNKNTGVILAATRLAIGTVGRLNHQIYMVNQQFCAYCGSNKLRQIERPGYMGYFYKCLNCGIKHGADSFSSEIYEKDEKKWQIIKVLPESFMM
jgi:hypothetical protein